MLFLRILEIWKSTNIYLNRNITANAKIYLAEKIKNYNYG